MAITLDGTTGITTPGLTNTGTTTIVDLTTTGNTTLGDATTDTLTVGVTGIVKDASGNVGIGTASPGYKLDVSGVVRSTGTSATLSLSKRSTGSGDAWGMYSQSGEYNIYDFTASASRLVIDSSGNVGIGVTPSAWNTGKAIEVSSLGTALWSSGAGSTSLVAGAYYNSGWKYANATSRPALIDFDNAGKISLLTTAATGTAGNAITFTTVMQINTTGTGIGMAPVSSVQLAVAAGSSFIMVGRDSTGATDQIRIAANGNVTNTNNSYSVISDIKLKENIVDATPKLSSLMQVRVVNYNLKANLGYEQNKQIGVVAQELESIFPSLIEETIDRDIDGNELGTTTKGVKMSVFVPMLIKAIQEQQALIQSLTTRLTALENK
jgi:hypothetical protein